MEFKIIHVLALLVTGAGVGLASALTVSIP